MKPEQTKELLDALTEETAFVQTNYTLCKNGYLRYSLVIMRMYIRHPRLCLRCPGMVHSYCRELYHGRNG